MPGSEQWEEQTQERRENEAEESGVLGRPPDGAPRFLSGLIVQPPSFMLCL